MAIEARAVFCDDIRREDNGKAILIGVYTNDLIPGTLPTNLSLSLWLDVRGIPEGHHQVKISVNPPAGEKISIPGEIDVHSTERPVTLMFVGVPVILSEPGLIKIFIDISGIEVVAGQLIVTEPPQLQAEKI